MNRAVLSLRGRILWIGGVSGLLGAVCVAGLMACSSRRIIERQARPLVDWIIAREHPRCSTSPATWSATGPDRMKLWAYDAGGRAANPEAPVLLPELVTTSSALVLSGVGRGAILAVRVDDGQCAIVAGYLPPLLSRANAFVVLGASGLLTALIGAAIAALASARPLRELRRARAQVADHAAALAATRDELQRQIADVAHDVRTPIASLQLALEQAIAAAGDPAEVEACLVRAVHDVTHVGGLVGNLHLAADLRAGSLAATGTANLDELVERGVIRSRFLARQKQIALELSLPDSPSTVVGSPIAIAQAVGNVLDNAVAYVQPGGHVAVVLERLDDTFQLVIADDGPGVSADELPRLGDRTFRTDEARRRDSRGSGLGLAITTEVCRQLRWTLAFERGEPSGLRVVITGAITN